MLDLLIRGATIVDGTGAAPAHGSVGVRDGRIVALGDVAERARRTVDADGRVVAPGFVDVHTHYDAQAFWDPFLTPSPLHGVTTVVAGNCGFTIAPLADDSAEYLMRMLARVEGMPLEALEQGVPWSWRTVGEYLDLLDGTLALNTGFMVGHSAIRRAVLGPDASVRTATDDELRAMRALLADGLAAGGVGLSTSLGGHRDGDGNPVPSRLADEAELVGLAEVCRRFDGTSLEIVPGPIDDGRWQIMAAMSRAAGRAINWNVMVVSAHNAEESVARLDAGERAAGADASIVALTMPIIPVTRFSFATGFLLDRLPGWGEPMALPVADKLALLRDPVQRQRLADLAAGPNPAAQTIDARWDQRVVAETFTPETARHRGRIVADIARDEAKTPFDALVDICCADGLRTIFTNIPVVETDADWQAKLRIWRDDRSLIGGSDAGAHLDFLATFNYPTFLLGTAVRDQGLLPIEEAVRMLTGDPARLYGLRDRGTIAVGSHADVVLVDPDTVASEPVVTRYDVPGGAGRLYAGATGIDGVFVAGVEIVSGGELTGERPGRVIRSGRDTTSAR